MSREPDIIADYKAIREALERNINYRKAQDSPLVVKYYDENWQEQLLFYKPVPEMPSVLAHQINNARIIANRVNSGLYDRFHISSARQYGQSITLEIAEQFYKGEPAPAPEPKNWYQEYAQPRGYRVRGGIYDESNLFKDRDQASERLSEFITAVIKSGLKPILPSYMAQPVQPPRLP